jgi:hypothetical protein
MRDADGIYSEEEEPDDYPFPLTLKMKKGANSGPNSPAPLVGVGGAPVNGSSS